MPMCLRTLALPDLVVPLAARAVAVRRGRSGSWRTLRLRLTGQRQADSVRLPSHLESELPGGVLAAIGPGASPGSRSLRDRDRAGAAQAQCGRSREPEGGTSELPRIEF